MSYILIIVYLSRLPGAELSVKTYPMETQQKCNEKAKIVFNNVKSGQVRAFCFKKGFSK